jgi:hypothetical protein
MKYAKETFLTLPAKVTISLVVIMVLFPTELKKDILFPD